MKKLLALLSLIIICAAFTSCKKNDNPAIPASPYYLNFKIDGVQRKMDSVGCIQDTTSIPIPFCSIVMTGTYEHTTPNEMFEIVGFTTSTAYLKANTVFVSTDNSNDNHNALGFSYVYNGQILKAITDHEHLKVTITAVTKDDFSGTFSGVLLDTSGKSYTITEGAFHCPFIR